MSLSIRQYARRTPAFTQEQSHYLLHMASFYKSAKLDGFENTFLAEVCSRYLERWPVNSTQYSDWDFYTSGVNFRKRRIIAEIKSLHHFTKKPSNGMEWYDYVGGDLAETAKNESHASSKSPESTSTAVDTTQDRTTPTEALGSLPGARRSKAKCPLPRFRTGFHRPPRPRPIKKADNDKA
ncbi:hypothetical protein CPB83DRAFT_898543 [Crepidotus variabilis]|uniref:Uncharacterized protein n=1 Tax=Crepidotus variabilis TaxID=179855 RepID=A0A9P6E726_9AGAR|nr:hypothetical protein CPB83DRAFT_898543 [Crepidotus variabilis]